MKWFFQCFLDRVSTFYNLLMKVHSQGKGSTNGALLCFVLCRRLLLRWTSGYGTSTSLKESEFLLLCLTQSWSYTEVRKRLAAETLQKSWLILTPASLDSLLPHVFLIFLDGHQGILILETRYTLHQKVLDPFSVSVSFSHLNSRM